MRKFHSDNEMLMQTLIDNGINLTCNENMEVIISDEDAERIENMVPSLCPAAMGDYSIDLLPGEYYIVQYDHPVLYLRLDSFPPHTFRWRIICDTIEEAKKVFEHELSVTGYRKIEEIGFKPTNAEFGNNAFNLCIEKLTIDEDGDEEYEIMIISEQTFYHEN